MRKLRARRRRVAGVAWRARVKVNRKRDRLSRGANVGGRLQAASVLIEAVAVGFVRLKRASVSTSVDVSLPSSPSRPLSSCSSSSKMARASADRNLAIFSASRTDRHSRFLSPARARDDNGDGGVYRRFPAQHRV